MNEIRVTGWNDISDELYAGAWQETIGRFRSTEVFRGLPDATYDLTTGLMRLGRGFEQLESHLLRTFRRYAHRYAAPGDSIWNWLALAQHHGLPTRLLDWTYSPYVALHFATDEAYHTEVDSAIWCINYVKTNQLLPTPLRAVLRQEGADVFTAEMLNQAAATLTAFDRLAEDPFITFFEPPSLDDRIVNQFALFSLPSSPTIQLDRWLEERPDVARKIIIPASAQREIRDKLDQANITERVLFPGLDGISSWLTRYYRPKSD